MSTADRKSKSLSNIPRVIILRAASGPTFGVGTNSKKFRYYTPSFRGHAGAPTKSTIAYRNSKNKTLKVGYVIQDYGNGKLIVEEVARSPTTENNYRHFLSLVYPENLERPIIRRVEINQNHPKHGTNNFNLNNRFSLDLVLRHFNDAEMKHMYAEKALAILLAERRARKQKENSEKIRMLAARSHAARSHAARSHALTGRGRTG